MNSLQYLLFDPHYGYLYPHRHAIAALGLPNEYQLSKHRPRLVEGQHWHKIRGTDHVDRLFYTLPGLRLLTELVATPHAQAFWQSLTQVAQSGGALVKVQPAALYTELEPSPAIAEAAPFVDAIPASPPNLPPYALTQHLPPQFQQTVSSPLVNSGQPPSTLTPQETAALIFKAQEVMGEQIAKSQAAAPKVNITIWQQWDNWIDSQDSAALAILYSLIILFIGFGAYLLFLPVAQRGSLPPSQPQPQLPLQ